MFSLKKTNFCVCLTYIHKYIWFPFIYTVRCVYLSKNPTQIYLNIEIRKIKKYQPKLSLRHELHWKIYKDLLQEWPNAWEREWSLEQAGSKAEAPWQRAPPESKAVCMLWRLCYNYQPGEEIRRHKTWGKYGAAQLSWQREIPELPKLAGDANGFLCIICYENTAQRKAWEEALAPQQEGRGRSVCSITWGWQQGGNLQPAGCGPSMW